LLEYFNAEVGREEMFKSTFRKESLYEMINDNGLVRAASVGNQKICQEYNVPMS